MSIFLLGLTFYQTYVPVRYMSHESFCMWNIEFKTLLADSARQVQQKIHYWVDGTVFELQVSEYRSNNVKYCAFYC